MALAAGCDPGPATDASREVGPPIHVIASNVSGSKPLPATGSIELAFDRLLLPESITRQSFLVAGFSPPPLPSYDPVTRIVTIAPLAPLVVGQTYELKIKTPQSDSDLSGLRAIDGATIDPKEAIIPFMVVAPPTTTIVTAANVVFCASVRPILSANCTASICHGGFAPAAGLQLDDPKLLAQTAIGKVAHGANSGPTSNPQPAGLRFGVDMPIIDPGQNGTGNPGNSFLIYKLLLAEIPPGSPGATPIDDPGWKPLSDAERTVLGSYVDGREMPFPAGPKSSVSAGLSTADMDTLSLWIAQGATVPPSCP